MWPLSLSIMFSRVIHVLVLISILSLSLSLLVLYVSLLKTKNIPNPTLCWSQNVKRYLRDRLCSHFLMYFPHQDWSREALSSHDWTAWSFLGVLPSPPPARSDGMFWRHPSRCISISVTHVLGEELCCRTPMSEQPSWESGESSLISLVCQSEVCSLA